MSQHEPLDDLPPELRAMLDLAREPDTLAPEVSDRMLRALDARVVAEAAAPSGDVPSTSRRGPFFRAPWQTLAGFVLGALLGAGVYHLTRGAPPERVVIRERVVTQERVVRVEVPAPAPAPRPAPAPQDVVEAPAPQRHRARDERDDLAAEQALLDAARVALRGGDATGALRRLDEHARRFRRGQLAPERELLRVRALVRAGRLAEATEVAARFRRRFPRHALRPAVDAALR